MSRLAARTHALVLALSCSLAACIVRDAQAGPPRSAKPVRYAIAIEAPATQYVEVAMHVDDPRGSSSDVAMPAWTPGSYLIRDFARHVYDLRATDGRGRELVVTRRDKQTWGIAHGGRAFTVTYRVYAAEVGVRTSHVDDRHASLLGASLLLYVRGELSRSATVDLALPKGWTAHVALPQHSAADGHVRITAKDYDALVDAPIELGTPDVRRFSVGGSEFEYVLTAGDTLAADPQRLVDDARKVVTAYGELMGGFPMQRYLFLVEATDSGGGGLEHASCTSMILRRDMFDGQEGYASAARLAAHEFFHLWNVKRIHDRALGPFDYSRENHSRLLWFHEGFTETMEGLAMLRAGLVTPKAHVQGLGGAYTRYRARPGRNHDPLSQLSFEAWVKGYQPADNHRNDAISYYTKGDIVGVALDLELRLRAAERGREGSLPGLFRRLMRSHGSRGVGITMRDIIGAASDEAGEDMAWFFRRFVDGVEEVELAPLLERIGIVVEESKADGVFTGLRLGNDGGVADVELASPAQDAGFMRGDRLLAIEGQRADSRGRAERWFRHAGAGATVEVAAYRGDRLITLSLTPTEDPARTWAFSIAKAPNAVRDGWLGSASPPSTTAETPAVEASATSD